MASIFTRIINGEIPSYKIEENEYCYSFLDINPLAKGHTLVIPKKETDYLFDLDDENYRRLWDFSKQIAKKINKVIECERVGVAVIGLEVPHAHIHLVPIKGVHDIDFSKPKLELSEEEFKAIAKKIKNA